MEIKGYTLHGDYYLADKIIPGKTWKEAIKMKEEITLPNGKKVIAHTLSKEELETIPQEERKIDKNGHFWYWTSTPSDDKHAWNVHMGGYFNYNYFDFSGVYGGVPGRCTCIVVLYHKVRRGRTVDPG
jgi:hypothetical protein